MKTHKKTAWIVFISLQYISLQQIPNETKTHDLTKIFPFCRLHEVSETIKLGKTENKKGILRYPPLTTYRLTQSECACEPNTSLLMIA